MKPSKQWFRRNYENDVKIAERFEQRFFTNAVFRIFRPHNVHGIEIIKTPILLLERALDKDGIQQTASKEVQTIRSCINKSMIEKKHYKTGK